MAQRITKEYSQLRKSIYCNFALLGAQTKLPNNIYLDPMYVGTTPNVFSESYSRSTFRPYSYHDYHLPCFPDIFPFIGYEVMRIFYIERKRIKGVERLYTSIDWEFGASTILDGYKTRRFLCLLARLPYWQPKTMEWTPDWSAQGKLFQAIRYSMAFLDFGTEATLLSVHSTVPTFFIKGHRRGSVTIAVVRIPVKVQTQVQPRGLVSFCLMLEEQARLLLSLLFVLWVRSAGRLFQFRCTWYISESSPYSGL